MAKLGFKIKFTKSVFGATQRAKIKKEILQAVETIKNGKVGYTIYEYESRDKKCYSISFVDL